ncbi:putative NADPH-dependent methylglyoxal reductase GRP2 [Candida viswanathii]|uniref:Putative NADPH-dependent methylglyoxal reductase GRP2 n=1 Tax=Candida viswanathii TaxID=5486 RepID=A0A367XRH0_9ASCO|nr:putative NADPH-dependent methylglyoxal reductase GRP2 [Candida viswanathii]
MTKVFVTGATGFIAQHIIKLLLSKGYEVVGTVRSASKGEQMKSMMSPTAKFSYEVVPELSTPDAFDAVLSRHTDITYLFHAASPLTFDTEDPENVILQPAIRGTENILNAAAAHCPGLKRIVLTSSDAAMYSNVDETNPELSFNEGSWNNTKYEDAVKDNITAYYASKAFAEKAAWEFVMMQKPLFGLVVVNPSWVFGPKAYDFDPKRFNSSNELIDDVLKLNHGNNSTFENVAGGFISVNDIAKVQVYAIESDELVNKRLLMQNGFFTTQLLLDIVNKNFPELDLPKGNPGTEEEEFKKLANVSNNATKKLLPWEFESLESIVVATVKQILEPGKE